MRRVLLVVLAAAISVALLLGAAVSASAGTLDQQQTSSNANLGLTSSQSAAQTFTAGVTGRVDQVDLLLSKVGAPPAYVTVEIRNTSAGAPGVGVLAAASIPTSSIGFAQAFIPVTFATPAPVTAGTKYAIVAYSPGTFGDAVGAWYQTADVYSGGSLFESFESLPPGAAWIDLGDDQAFKTYVVPTPPATGQRAAALKKCKKKHSKKARKKCRKKAQLLPV